MTASLELGVPAERLKQTAAALSALAATAGLAVLSGWALDWDWPLNWGLGPDQAAMNPLTALCMVACGCAIPWRVSDIPRARGACAAALSLVFAACVLRLAAYGLGLEAGVDMWLFAGKLGKGAVLNRMAPNTALAFALLSASALPPPGPSRLRRGVTEAATLVAGAVAAIAVLGYFYSAASLHQVRWYISMAVNTAAGLVLLSGASFLSRPDRPLAALLAGRGAGSDMARSLLPAVLLAPPALGWLRLHGEYWGLYRLQTGVALLTLSITLLLSALLLWTAAKLNGADAQTQQARAKAESQSMLLQSILDAISDGVVVADAQGRFILFNPAAQRIVGLGATEAPPERWPEVYGAFLPDGKTPFPSQDLPLVRAIGGETLTDVEVFMRSPRIPEGATISVNATPLKDARDRLEGGIAVFRDVSHRKLAERQIRDYASRLEAANKELEAFTYSVSHDLRAPLRAIDGFARILAEEHAQALGPEPRRLLDVVRSNASRMAQLIDDLLAFSRLSRQELRRVEVDMARLAAQAADLLCQGEPKRRAVIRVDPMPAAEGDPAMLRQVWANLLSNALKFSRSRPETPIEAGAEVEDGGVAYYVKDKGVGFDMRYAHKLFGVFQRLHSLEEYEGTGVGLAIVQRVVTRHGGKVWAEGQVDRGACFRFTLIPGEPS